MRKYGHKLSYLLFCFFIVAGSLSSTSVQARDPRFEYFTIKTEHFNIHYHKEIEHIAKRGATIFEEVHNEISILLEWEVDGPTEVFLIDDRDSANGFASVFHNALDDQMPSRSVRLPASRHIRRRLPLEANRPSCGFSFGDRRPAGGLAGHLPTAGCRKYARREGGRATWQAG